MKQYIGCLFMVALFISISTAQSKFPKASELGMMRAVHMGGNWGLNVNSVLNPPQEYFDWLHKINVNWVGISVALHVNDSMDSLVARKYSGVAVPAFADSNLKRTIRSLRANGFNVYLTLSLEDAESSVAARPVHRWQMGDPATQNSSILPQNWPWSTTHPQYTSFVKSFWRTYTNQAVYYARICNSENVGIFSLGTETDRLFRTRTGGVWINNFKNELKAMVDSVRLVYPGLVSFDQSFDVDSKLSYYSPSADHIWEDLGLDIVAVSAYFPLTSILPTSVMSIADLKKAWENVFTNYLVPSKTANSTKPMVFLEFGYDDDIGTPYQTNINEFNTKVFHDANANGLDDGEETQRNIYSAFFATNEKFGKIVQGAFLWGNDMSGNQQWANSFGKMIDFSFRQKLAEDTVRAYYAKYSIPADVQQNMNKSIPINYSLDQNFPNPFNPTTKISYQLPQLSKVSLRVYDLLGREVAELVNEEKQAGVYSAQFDAGKLTSGVYFYRLQAGSFVETKKLLFMK